jgi:hypothetical protein
MSMAQIMQAMSEAGAPFEAILIAVRAIEERDAAIADRRAAERDRKRRQRERDSHGTVTGQSEDAGGQPPVLDKESVPQTPFKEIKPTPRTVRGSACGVYLPVGWKPSTFGVGTIAGEIVGRRGQDWAKRAFETFENHWRAATGKTARKGDWQATWANWVIEQDRRDGQNGTRQSNSQYGLRGSRPDPAVDMLRAANAELEAERAAGYQEDDFGIGLPLPAYLTS